jgi:putative ABC transport system permease protein
VRREDKIKVKALLICLKKETKAISKRVTDKEKKKIRNSNMILNLKLIIRNLLNGKIQTVLNVFGLAIGFACSIAIIVWVKNELSYDRHLPDASRIYRLTFETNTAGMRMHFARCWEPWVSQIPAAFPQVEELVRLDPYRHTALKIGENKFYSDRVFATDTNFFKVFNISLLSGQEDKVLKEPYTAVISRSIALKCFGNTDPIGKTLLISGEYDQKMVLFTITGVMMDTPSNSHIHFDILTSFVNPKESPDWAYIYLLLKKQTSPDQILGALPSFIQNVEKTSDKRTFTPFLQKISDIHLYSNKDREAEPNGNITNVYVFIIIAAVLLAVSLANFYNLNKARLITLRKSIDIQRAMGSENNHIILQSILESAICVFSALIFALVLLDLSELFTSSYLGFMLFPDGITDIIRIWPFIIILIIFSLLAGSLPVVLNILNTSINIQAFGAEAIQGTKKISSYGILMTIQFCLAIILMVSAITIFKQKKFIFSQSIGKMSSDIMVFKSLGWEIRGKYTAIRDQALQDPLIKNFTASMEEPGGETMDAMLIESSGLDENHKDKQLYVLPVEDNFLEFFDLPLIAGHNFSKFNPEGKREDYILNETAIKELGWTPQEAIGKPLKVLFDTPDIFYGGTVVGVAKDFNITTVKQNIKPYVLFQKPLFYLCYIVRTDSANKQQAILNFKKIWEKELPDYPFQYELLGDSYKTTYKKEVVQSKLTISFSILAIVIICMGLFTITSLLITKRTREIGIRKVNGARVINLLVMLNSDFTRWFIVAFIFACPVAYYAMHHWLQNFTYKTELSWWVFAVSGIIVLSVTLLTVTMQCWRAATRNPVEALRYE